MLNLESEVFQKQASHLIHCWWNLTLSPPGEFVAEARFQLGTFRIMFLATVLHKPTSFFPLQDCSCNCQLIGIWRSWPFPKDSGNFGWSHRHHEPLMATTAFSHPLPYLNLCYHYLLLPYPLKKELCPRVLWIKAAASPLISCCFRIHQEEGLERSATNHLACNLCPASVSPVCHSAGNCSMMKRQENLCPSPHQTIVTRVV